MTGKAHDVQVKFNRGDRGEAQWNFVPPVLHVDKGDNTITFRRMPDQATWKLTGISIWQSGGSKPGASGSVSTPFQVSSVGDAEIVVGDDNPGEDEIRYNYMIYIQDSDGNTLNSDPEIVNKKGEK
jgi:hypothetical protein